VLTACPAKPTATPVPPPPTEAPKAAEVKPTEAPKPTEVPTAKPPAEVVTITYWEQEGDDIDVLLDEWANAFMAANPGVKVERTHFGNEELRDQFQTASLAGEAPALARCPNDFAGPFSALDIIKPVKEVYDQKFLDQFFAGALGPAVVKGTLWAVPDNYGNHLMLLYNKKLVSEVPADTDAWIAQLKTLTDEAKGQYGLVYNLNEPFWLAPWIGGFGAWPLDEQDQPSLGAPGVADALQFVHDLKFVHKVVPPEADYNAADTMFKQGQAAYLINGDWSLGGYKDAGLDFGTAALPKITKSGQYPSPMTAGKYWFFSKALDSAKLEAAKKFVDYMTSAEVQKKWLEKGRLPSNKEVAKDPSIASDPILVGSMAQLANGKGMPAAPEMRCAWDAMRPNLEAVMADTAKPADAAAAMQTNALKCVAEMKGQKVEETPAAEGKLLKIGQLSQLSGAMALYGQQQVRGFALGLEYASGGKKDADGHWIIAGRPVEVITRDDEGNAEKGVQLARELIEKEGVEILQGPVSSAVAVALTTIAQENKIILMVDPAASAFITGKNFNPYVFRTSRTNYDDTLVIAKYLVENVGKKFAHIGIDNAFGRGSGAALAYSVKKFGGEVIADIYAPFDTTDFTSYIQQAMDSKADCLFLTWAGTGYVTLFQQLGDLGALEQMRVATGYGDNASFAAVYGSAVGQIGLNVYHYTAVQNPVNDWLVKRHLEEFKEPPDLFTAGGMASAIALAAALEKTGGDATGDKLIPALEGLKFEGPKGTYYIRPEDHVCEQPMNILKLVNVNPPKDDQGRPTYKFFETVYVSKYNELGVPCTLAGDYAQRCGSLPKP
jgi:maltose-binding protein MalE/ABC-type branched-subunit amino acid transport system substrate-binding protein